VVKDAHVAEDIFQNTVLKAITKDVNFEAEAALFSWAFITARRDSLNWFRKHRRESVGIDEDILILIHQDCHKIKRKPFHIYHQTHEN